MKNKSNSIESLKSEGLVTTADKIAVPANITMEEAYIISDWYLRYQKDNPWIFKIENYCSIEGILPEDLILAHKEAQGGLKKKKLSKDQQMVKDAFKAAKNDHSKWNEQYKNKKLGIS